MKAAFSADDRPAADDRLIAEESELLQRTGQMLAHDDDTAIAEACTGTRDVIARLQATGPDAGR